MERHLRASATAGRQAARARAAAQAPQRYPGKAAEIFGAAAARRFAQPRKYSSGRARDHRARLIYATHTGVILRCALARLDGWPRTSLVILRGSPKTARTSG